MIDYFDYVAGFDVTVAIIDFWNDTIDVGASTARPCVKNDNVW